MALINKTQEKFIRQVRSVNGRNIDLKNIDLDKIEKSTEFKNPDISNKDLVQVFETLYEKELDLEHETNNLSHGRYKDPKTEVTWRAFKTAFKIQANAIARSRGRLNRSAVKMPFIVGMEVDDGTVQFGYRPYKHTSFELAQEEAKKLCAKFKRNYSIFGVVGKEEATDVKGSTPVEETKQKERGKIQANPKRVFDEYQDYIKKQTNGLEPGFPIEINFGATGDFILKLWMRDEVLKFNDFQHLVNYLNVCLKKVKRQEEEEDKAADDTSFSLPG